MRVGSVSVRLRLAEVIADTGWILDIESLREREGEPPGLVGESERKDGLGDSALEPDAGRALIEFDNDRVRGSLLVAYDEELEDMLEASRVDGPARSGDLGLSLSLSQSRSLSSLSRSESRSLPRSNSFSP